MKAILYGIFNAVSSAGETLAVKALNYIGRLKRNLC